MRFLHTMLRVRDLDKALHFYCNLFGLTEIRRYENEKGRFTLVFLTAEKDLDRARAEMAPCLELTYNWDTEDYTGGRHFGHLAYEVDDIYAICQKLMDNGEYIVRNAFEVSAFTLDAVDHHPQEAAFEEADALPQPVHGGEERE